MQIRFMAGSSAGRNQTQKRSAQVENRLQMIAGLRTN
jgi:hypothetical protein